MLDERGKLALSAENLQTYPLRSKFFEKPYPFKYTFKLSPKNPTVSNTSFQNPTLSNTEIGKNHILAVLA